MRVAHRYTCVRVSVTRALLSQGTVRLLTPLLCNIVRHIVIATGGAR